MSHKNHYYYAFTPAGSLVDETESPTLAGCRDELLRIASHMPYGTWENFKKRGYEIWQWERGEWIQVKGGSLT